MESKFEINRLNSFHKENDDNNVNEIFSSKIIDENDIKDNKKISAINHSFSLNNEIDRKRSSDSTSISLSQIENLSQISESSLLIPLTNESKIIQNGMNSKDFVQDDEINFFSGVENYYYKTMREKFFEYKKTKNYILKKSIKEQEQSNKKKEEEKIINKESKINENNKFNYNNQLSNNSIHLMHGNALLYSYNTFCFNYPYFNLVNNDSDFANKKEQKEKNNNDNKESTNINEKFENDFELKDEQDSDDSIYIIEKQNNNRTNYKFNKEKNKNIYENISKDFNFNQKNYNCKYKYKYNYIKGNNKYNQNIDYNKTYINYFCHNLNDHYFHKRKNYYNKNVNYKNKPKVIYY